MSLNDNTLFRGTSWYYSHYRPKYPSALFDLLVRKFSLNKQHKILDLGAGTGELAVPLSKYVGEVIAVEPDPEMIDEGKRQSMGMKADNIVWETMRAEDFEGLQDSFRLATIGQALHWMDQQKVLGNVIRILAKDGGLAVVTGRSIWNGPELWQQRTVEVIKRFLGDERRAGKGMFKSDSRKHEDVITELPFSRSEVTKLINVYHWNIGKIIGYLYSTSFATKHLFGDRSQQFEKELKQELLNLNPSGEFTESQEINVILAWK